jgi:hypothetical protein
LILSGAGAYWGISLGRGKNRIGVLTSNNATTPEDFSISHPYKRQDYITYKFDLSRLTQIHKKNT